MSVNVALSPIEEKSTLYHPSQLDRIDLARIPQHIAFIPDGNRRWTKNKSTGIIEGHREGADTLIEIIKAAQELNIKTMTVYSFSTENWNRSAEEISAFMLLLNLYIEGQCESMIQNGIRLDTIGDLSTLPLFLRETIQRTKEATQQCDRINLILAMNYGSRNELCRAFNSILNDYENKLLTKEKITEETISRYLDTHKWGDPDLLIRTSGELRLSNFLLWQMSYSEIHVSPVLWPDFTPDHLLDAIIDFQSRQRRWGGA